MMSITNGGTGASTVEQARTNLEVYSKTEITNLIADTKRYADRNLQQVSTSSDKSIASLASNLSHEIDRLDSLASEARKTLISTQTPYIEITKQLLAMFRHFTTVLKHLKRNLI